jgi:hypothetical protein
MPIDQPIRIRRIGIPTQPSHDEILFRGQPRVNLGQFVPNDLDLTSRDEAVLSPRGETGSRARDSRGLSGAFVTRCRVGWVTGVDVSVGVDGEFHDPVRVGREAVESRGQVEVLEGEGERERGSDMDQRPRGVFQNPRQTLLNSPRESQHTP